MTSRLWAHTLWLTGSLGRGGRKTMSEGKTKCLCRGCGAKKTASSQWKARQ